MAEITAMLKELVGTYQVIKGSEYLFTPPREVVGRCPRCGGEIAEMQKGFFCPGQILQICNLEKQQSGGPQSASSPPKAIGGGAAKRWPRPCDGACTPRKAARPTMPPW